MNKKMIELLEQREREGKELATKIWNIIIEKNVTDKTLYNVLQSMLRKIERYEYVYLSTKKASEIISENY